MSDKMEESKLTITKVPVVFLSAAQDFNAWHLALRRLVKSCNMGESLMYSVPESQMPALDERLKATEKKVKEEGDKIKGEEEKFALFGGKLPTTSVIDLTETPLTSKPRSEEDTLIMKSLGISSSMEDFFASTVRFIKVRGRSLESEKELYYRQEIWSWMEQSLCKGTFKWLARSIAPIYDIHALYTKVTTLANKATWISYSLEFKKIFTMSCTGNDIFQYHAELLQQIQLVKAQGESLGLTVSVPRGWNSACFSLQLGKSLTTERLRSSLRWMKRQFQSSLW
jgi:hypothetical protein